MKFTDYPQPIPLSLYEDAIQEYTALVAKRIHAIYQTGAISAPGISDVDLIVVPREPRRDNHLYFSRRRLGRPARMAFRHDPFVLPQEACGVLRYTTHTKIRFISGRDVIPGEMYVQSLEDRWAMLFEDYCRYYRFLRTAAEKGQLSVRFLLSKLHSIRIPLQTVANIGGMAADTGSANWQQAHELRTDWFTSRRDPQLRAQEAWSLLRTSFEQLTTQLGELLSVSGSDDLNGFAFAFLNGERRIPGLDLRALEVRKQVIRDYLEQMCRLGFSTGSLVAKNAYAQAFRSWELRYRPSPVVRGTLTLWYQAERVVRALQRNHGNAAPGRLSEVAAAQELSSSGSTKTGAESLSAKAWAGKVKTLTGISVPHEDPEQPAIVVDTATEKDEAAVTKVLARLEGEGILLETERD